MKAKTPAFTLVELLVVIAIVAMLVAILLPAVQAAREAARRTVCQNHLKQLALAALLHHEQQGRFPTRGWLDHDYYWTGDPHRGFGRNQPGGWAYQILPFIEQSALFDLGSRLVSHDVRALAIKQRVATPVPVYFCPSRRGALVLKGTEERPAIQRQYRNAPQSAWRTHGPVTEYAPIDYAANGDARAGGVISGGDGARMAQITDGTSKTCMMGEKFLWVDYYNTNWVSRLSDGDEQWLHNGEENDGLPFDGWGSIGSDYHGMGGRARGCEKYERDRPLLEPRSRCWGFVAFGSAHREGGYFAMCDGSVRPVPYVIEWNVFSSLVLRDDGEGL